MENKINSIPDNYIDHLKESNIVTCAEENIMTALCNAQKVMAGAKKDKKNPFFKSSYADLASVFDAIREPFSSNGLSITQIMDIAENGRTILITRLMHKSGEFIESKIMLSEIFDCQKMGAQITYYRRFCLMAIAGIPAEDDDGNTATNKKAPAPRFINDKQVSNLESIINGHDDIRELVLKNCNGSMGSITIDRYPGAVEWIKGLVKEKGSKND